MLESYLNVTVRKKVGAKLNFVKPQKIIPYNELEQNPVRINEEIRKQKQEKLNEIKKGEFDFSNKKKTENLTLDDLRKLKQEREQKQSDEDDIESLTADDIELDEEI